jgi:PAS domain S-box-containing protein
MNITLLILAEFLFISILILFLFKLRNKLGLAPLYIFIGSIQYLQTILATIFYIKLFDKYFVSPGSILLFSSTLFALLLVYIKEGVYNTRALIFGILITNISLSVISGITVLEGNSFPTFLQKIGNAVDIFDVDYRIFFIGTLIFIIDLVLMIVIYKWLITKFKSLHLFLVIFISLSVALCFDSFAFTSAVFYDNPGYQEILISQLVAKNIATLLFASLLYGYIKYFDAGEVKDSMFISDSSSDIFSIITSRRKYDALRAEKKEAEEKIKVSEENYRTLVEQASDAIILFDRQGKFLEANTSAEKLSGYTKSELSGMTVFDLMDTENLKTSPLMFEEVLQGKTVVTERKYIKKDATVMDVEVSSKFLTNGYFQSIARDITQRKKVEKELRKFNQRFEMINLATKEALWEWNLVTGELWGNEAHQMLYGLTMADPVPNEAQWIERIHPEDRAKTVQAQVASLKSDMSIFLSEYRFRNANEEYRDIYDRCYILRDADGKAISKMGSMMDITDQKKAEKALAEREEHMLTILQTEPECIKQIGSKGELIYMNPAGLAMIEASNLDMVLGKSLTEILLPPYRKAFEQLIKDVFNGKSGMLEFEIKALKGTHRWLETHSVPLRNAAGKIISLLSVTRDISERKKSDQQLIESELKYRTMVEKNLAGIYQSDLSGKILACNDAFARILGYRSQEELLKEAPANIYFSAADQDEFNTALKINGELNNYEGKLKHISGREVYVTQNCFVRHDLVSGDEIIEGAMIDITERKKAKVLLIREKELSDSIINSLPGIFYLFSEDRKFIRWNKNFEKVSGYDTKELQVIKPIDFYEGEGRELVQENFSRVLQFGESSFEANFITKYGEKIPYYFTGNLVQYEGRPCLIGTGIDISERKKAEEELTYTYRQLRQLTAHLQHIREEERKRISREIHDELGQQLTAIKMDMVWIAKNIPENAIPVKSKLNNSISLLEESNRSVRKILNTLRMDLLDDQDLPGVLERLVHQFIENTDIPLSFNCTASLVNVSEPVANCIFRVFQEALTNITRYAGATEVNSTLFYAEGKLILEIEDNGTGFDTALLNKKRSFGILGMKERVASLRGNFELISFPGKGTKITIRLPYSN